MSDTARQHPEPFSDCPTFHARVPVLIWKPELHSKILTHQEWRFQVMFLLKQVIRRSPITLCGD